MRFLLAAVAAFLLLPTVAAAQTTGDDLVNALNAQIDSRTASLEQRIADLEAKVDGLDGRIGVLEDWVANAPVPTPTPTPTPSPTPSPTPTPSPSPTPSPTPPPTPTPTPTPPPGNGPTNTALPTVAGIADTGTFVAPQFWAKTAGTWTSGSTILTYTYQWQTCNSDGNNCTTAPGAAYGPGAVGSRCSSASRTGGCSYNLVANEATAPCPYATGATGPCTIRLRMTATSTDGTGTAATPASEPVLASSNPWPNYSNTGYQNAPGYPGTPGIADESKLTTASAGSSTCPTAIQSNRTYSFCKYNGTQFMGSRTGRLTNVHFVGSLFEDTGYGDAATIMLFCDSGCTFDHVTMKPSKVDAPDLPRHGTDYYNGYGAIMGAGWGAYGTVGHGVQITNSDIWGWSTGIILGSNSAATPNLFKDNWLHDQADCIHNEPDCTTHADGIGMVDTGGSSSYQTIDHNNMPFIQDNTNNIAFQAGTYDHLTVTNNILSGDGYTVAIWATSSNVKFTGNRWTNYDQHWFGVLYPQAFYNVTSNTWADNRFLWDPTGASPFFKNGPQNGNSGPITAADDNKCWVPSGLSTTDFGGGTC